MFPLTLTLHTPAQLSAVLRALQPELKASDFASPAVGAAYEEASARVAQRDAATPKAAGPDDGAQPAEAVAPGPKPPVPAPTRAASPAPGPRTATAAASPKAAAPAKTAAASAPAAAPAADQPQASTAAADPVVYAQVAAAITNAVKVSRQKAVDTLASFGARTGPELKPEQYAPFLKALAHALEEVAYVVAC